MKRRGYGSQQTDLSELRSQMKQQFIGLLPTHIDGNVRMAGKYKYKLESEPCKSKIGTGSVEFRTQKFLGTVLGTKSRFRDKKTPTRVSFFIWRQDWSNSFSSSGVFTLHTTASGRDVSSREMACPPTDWNSRPTRCSPAARAA